jgi:hypothetical protein
MVNTNPILSLREKETEISNIVRVLDTKEICIYLRGDKKPYWFDKSKLPNNLRSGIKVKIVYDNDHKIMSLIKI